jgi:lambda repressor-like predicted transcriptional regulator
MADVRTAISGHPVTGVQRDLTRPRVDPAQPKLASNEAGVVRSPAQAPQPRPGGQGQMQCASLIAVRPQTTWPRRHTSEHARHTTSRPAHPMAAGTCQPGRVRDRSRRISRVRRFPADATRMGASPIQPAVRRVRLTSLTALRGLAAWVAELQAGISSAAARALPAAVRKPSVTRVKVT